MFFTIFRYELRYWLRQPAVYIYAFIFLAVATGAMAAQAGIFGERQVVPGQVLLANAPLMLHEMAAFFLKLILFLIPAIFGLSIYRDFRSNMYTLLYSYPFTKRSYLLAKFSSALFILAAIVSAIGFGFFIGARLPGVNPLLVGPFQPAAYAQTYLIYLFPNILLFGAIIFAVVALTRNIYAGFITVILLFFVQMLAGSVLAGLDTLYLYALLDPFGQAAGDYYTRYWTFAERNELLLPVEGAIIYNRLLWLGISSVVFALAYKKFTFHQHAWGLAWKNPPPQRKQENKAGRLIRVALPNVRYKYSFGYQLKAMWRLSGFELAYILRSGLFLSILAGGILMVFFLQADLNPQFGFRRLPVTWRMLKLPAFLFLGVIHLLTFLYAGMLVHRARAARMDQLVDIAPVPNWLLLFSKLIALVKMQVLLLSLIMIGGIMVQLYHGYYKFEIGLYLFQLYGLYLPGLIIWAFAALFVQSMLTNPYLGLFLLILGSMGISGLPELGIEHHVFRYNQAPDFTYSDLDGFGASLPPWLLYKLYWLLGGLFLLMGALLFWTRGLTYSFAARLAAARARFRGRPAFFTLFFLLSFLALGFGIYYEDEYVYERINSAEEEVLWKVENEKKYKKFEHYLQPRITAVKVNVHLFPKTRSLRVDGEYTLLNRSALPIDTLLINYSYDEITSYQFGRATRLLSRDTFIRFDIHLLEESLAPGDSLKMCFEIRNEPNTLFRSSSPVKYNGTYFTNSLFPGLGYRPLELADNGKRAQYGLPARDDERPPPADSTAWGNSYASRQADWIDFEATISTSEDQIAIAPGYLQREWLENGRRYFHYKIDSKIKDYYGFNSARYEVKRDKWKDVSLEIYYHKGHEYTLESMMKGLKGALAYNTRYFGPYQHRQARIIEFPVTVGRFATTFANSIPFTEAYFITDADSSETAAADLSFYVSAHEMAHQWWGNQLLPADVLGAKMLTESMAEYTALKVLEKEYGINKARYFLKLDLDLYLRGRGREWKKERPLVAADLDQEYINYRKGALVLYALSDYIGEEKFNRAIRAYLEKVRFQEAPYTTSLEMLEYIRQATPDSLQYLVRDLCETITVYDNRVEEVSVKPLKNGRYQVDVSFIVSKYRSDGSGERSFEEGGSLSYQPEGSTAPIRSLPLQDYIELGVFGESQNALYLERHRISRIDNQLSIIVEEKPVEVGVDPYYKLIDARPGDNRRRGGDWVD